MKAASLAVDHTTRSGYAPFEETALQRIESATCDVDRALDRERRWHRDYLVYADARRRSEESLRIAQANGDPSTERRARVAAKTYAKACDLTHGRAHEAVEEARGFLRIVRGLIEWAERTLRGPRARRAGMLS